MQATLFRYFLLAALVVLATLAAYLGALDNALLATWDTQAYVTNNPRVQSLDPENLWWMLTGFHYANWHPLTWFSHAVDFALYGLDPYGHHLSSVLIHALNGVLLAMLVLALLGCRSAGPGESAWPGDMQSVVAAGLAALLFVVHPQHVESVAWVAERKDLLCQFFVLCCLICYCRFVISGVPARKSAWYTCALLCHLLALMAKPMAVSIPAVLLLIDVYPLHRTRITGGRMTWRPLILEKLPFALLSVGSAVLTLAAQESMQAVASIEQAGLEIRILNAFNSVVFYLSKLILPFHFSPYYPYPSYSGFREHYPSLLPVAAVCLASALCCLAWKRRSYHWTTAWVFYLLTLAPVIGVIQVGGQAAADRYAYLPTLPFYIVAGIGFASFMFYEQAQRSARLLLLAVAVAVLVGLAAKTRLQTEVWRDDQTLWQYVVASSPDSALAHSQLGNTYYIQLHDYPKAVEHFRRAIEIEPHNLHWYIKLPRAYIRAGMYEEALDLIEHVLRYDIDIKYSRDELYYLKGHILYTQGKLDGARAALEKAIRYNPENRHALDYLQNLD